jgi:tellurite resistance-related uncharacterized protein
VRRTIRGFHQDDAGDWVAELSCLHNQHVRHRPPFFDRPWVLEPEGRTSRIGEELDCALCDRAEMPDGLRLARTAGPFDDDTLPPGLRKEHHVADGTWGRLRVVSGSVDFVMQADARRLDAGAHQPIPPGVPHTLTFIGPAVIEIDFLVEP